MAHRTDYDPNQLGLFKHRLLNLMILHNVDSAKKLATALYNQKLVTVNSSKSFTDPEKVKINAIGSIEKKIQRHLQLDSPKDLQGEFIIAYSTFFGCSADYIICKTDIKSSDATIRDICIKTGLSEDVIIKLQKGGRYSTYSKYISQLIASPYFNDFIMALDDLDYFCNQEKRENPYISEINRTYDRKTQNSALELINLSEKELIEANPPEEVCNALKLFKQAIDHNYTVDLSNEHKEKILRYDLQASFDFLIRNMYPSE